VTIVNGYATRPEFQAWSQSDSSTKFDQMDSVVTAASRAIDEYCQRRFYQDGTVPAPVTRTFMAVDGRFLRLGPFNDLVSLSTLKTDAAGDGTFETTWTTTDYELGPLDRPPGRPYTQIDTIAGLQFPTSQRPGRSARVEVTGVWGWAAIPPEVHNACLIKAARLFTRMQSPNGIAGVDAFGPVRINRSEDGDVITLLDPLRHPATAVLVG
jgi:hypothetical protein